MYALIVYLMSGIGLGPTITSIHIYHNLTECVQAMETLPQPENSWRQCKEEKK